jgi:hypothetical protein
LIKKKRTMPTRNVMNAKIKKLVDKALKNKPKFKPAKGYKYIKDVNPGIKVTTQSEMLKALVLEHQTGSTTVIVYEVKEGTDYNKYYLGRNRWGNDTEVKEI